MTAAACASVWVLVASACACECLHALTETKIKCKSPAASCLSWVRNVVVIKTEINYISQASLGLPDLILEPLQMLLAHLY